MTGDFFDTDPPDADLFIDAYPAVTDHDTDSDGLVDVREYDEDRDGNPEHVFHIGPDGTVVSVESDTDDDGDVDRVTSDTDGDGVLDSVRRVSEGFPDRTYRIP